MNVEFLFYIYGQIQKCKNSQKMTQRLKNGPNNLNIETVPCEKFISRFLSKEKPSTVQKCREKSAKQLNSNQNQMSKMKPNVKQQNVPSPKHSQAPNHLFQCSDDSTLLELPIKITNPRQRSRSTTEDRGTWGQLLKQQKSGDKISVFGNFDPLRTLHFLAKELQYQLQTLLPDDSTVQQMIADIQYALKRVPPEVASTVHLQQAFDVFPPNGKNLNSDKPANPKYVAIDKCTQTPQITNVQDNEKLHKIMQESTLKLEASCKQMENLCTELKNERDYLAKQLETERESVAHLRRRIRELEIENIDIYAPRIKALEEEKRKLEAHFAETAKNLESEALATTADLKVQLAETKNAKMLVDQECNKLRHQLKLCGLEKDKYVTILAVRDKQIDEIRNEMNQLQDVVTEQLMELQHNAYQSMPSSENGAMACMTGEYDNKQNIGDIGDMGISTIYNNNLVQPNHMPRTNNSFRDLPAGDLDYSSVLEDYAESNIVKNGTHPKKDQISEKTESAANIRNMFSEIKKTAYSVASTPRARSQYNLLGNP